MAWIQKFPSSYHIAFRLNGTLVKRSLHTNSETEANTRLTRLEENLRLIASGRIDIPDDADPVEFLLADCKIAQKPAFKKPHSLASLCTHFFASIPNGNIEANTLKTMKIHTRHLRRHLGDRFSVRSLNLEDLQGYVSKREKEKGLRGKGVGPTTIKKELTTFCTIWSWAVEMGHLKGAFPRKGLRLPKVEEKPPFQTWAQIQSQINEGDFTEDEQSQLWDCLFLDLKQIKELVDFVEQTAHHPVLFPMIATAAHTGARRSELIRSLRSDLDEDTFLIRERKRVKGRQTTRRVPLSSHLKTILDDWLKIHPGGKHTFCLNGPMTPNQAHDHFKRTLAGSKWQVVPGWHCLRHSFCSNCALKGLDQRMIDSFVGHTTEEMSRRYRHLFPDSQKAAIELVFGQRR